MTPQATGFGMVALSSSMTANAYGRTRGWDWLGTISRDLDLDGSGSVGWGDAGKAIDYFSKAVQDTWSNADDIVVTARREDVQQAKRGLGWRIAEVLGAHKGGILYNVFGEPSSADEIVRATSGRPADAPFNSSQPFTVRSWVVQQRVADGAGGFVTSNFGRGTAFDRIATPIGRALDTTYRYTLGPGTVYDTAIVKRFYSTLDAIASTPLGDSGVFMSLESNGVTAPLGATASGIRALSRMRSYSLAAESEALTGTARARRLGIEGEQAIGITGPKVGIRIRGSNQLRFPDAINVRTGMLIESKNVAYQGYTRQLRDYSAYAQDKGFTFELYVRGALNPLGQTRLSGPLEAAVRRGEVVLKPIPGR